MVEHPWPKVDDVHMIDPEKSSVVESPGLRGRVGVVQIALAPLVQVRVH
jgi:hypothetical protein